MFEFFLVIVVLCIALISIFFLKPLIKETTIQKRDPWFWETEEKYVYFNQSYISGSDKKLVNGPIFKYSFPELTLSEYVSDKSNIIKHPTLSVTQSYTYKRGITSDYHFRKGWSVSLDEYSYYRGPTLRISPSGWLVSGVEFETINELTMLITWLYKLAGKELGTFEVYQDSVWAKYKQLCKSEHQKIEIPPSLQELRSCHIPNTEIICSLTTSGNIALKSSQEPRYYSKWDDSVKLTSEEGILAFADHLKKFMEPFMEKAHA